MSKTVHNPTAQIHDTRAFFVSFDLAIVLLRPVRVMDYDARTH